MRKSACARVKGVPLFIAGDMTYHALIGGYSTRKSIERDRPARQKIPPRAREGTETPPWRQRRQQGQRRPRRQTLTISAERYATVARAFETSRRRDVLSFSHHREVALLTPEDADRWLD